MLKALLIAIAISQGTDTASTCYALSKGYREGNPLLPSNCPAIVSIKTGMTAATIKLYHESHKKHPKLTKVLAAISVGVASYATIHNIRLATK